MISDPEFHRRLRPGDLVYANLYLSAGCETDSCVTLEVVGVDSAGRVECAAKAGGALNLDGIVTLFHVASSNRAGAAEGGAAAPPPHHQQHRRIVLSDEDKVMLEAFAARKLEVRRICPYYCCREQGWLLLAFLLCFSLRPPRRRLLCDR